MHALVTGASGFLGGRLVAMLLARGVQVSVLARPSSQVLPGVDTVRVQLDDSLVQVAPQLRGITHIFHCAGCSTDWASAAQYRAANVDGVRAMLALAAQLPLLERFVHVSTTDVYGYPRCPAIQVDESTPPHDFGLLYNQTKLQGEALVLASDLPFTVVRPASIYGPGGTAFVSDVEEMLRQRLMLLVDWGRVSGGFVYVDDVCEAMLLAARSAQALRQIYNLGPDEQAQAPITWRRYTYALAGALHLPRPWLQLPFGAAMALAHVLESPHRAGIPGKPLLTRHVVYILGRDQGYSVRKAVQELGWSPKIALEEGIARSVQWLRSRN